jgi:predicted nuclease with TOPRIM domain
LVNYHFIDNIVILTKELSQLTVENILLQDQVEVLEGRVHELEVLEERVHELEEHINKKPNSIFIDNVTKTPIKSKVIKGLGGPTR